MPPLLRTARRRIVGLASLATAAAVTIFTVATLPAGAQSQTPVATSPVNCAVLQLGNPNPGDLLPQGDYVVSGMAFDPNASQGAGVDRVDLFLGSRDSGGLALGSAVPGQNPSLNSRAFQIEVDLPVNANGQRDFVAYASSSVSGETMSVSVPVYIGAAPTPTPHTSSSQATPVPLTETVQSICTPVSAPPAALAAPSAPLLRPLLASATASSPVLQLGNPNSGDLLPTGDIVISGEAYDPAATQGSGIDQLEVFLDSRDSGGTPLGTLSQDGATAGRTFQIEAKVPNSANGGHTFVAYVRSSISGRETSVSVPVNVGVPPTPTPRPKQ
jgi:hypothetical protein